MWHKYQTHPIAPCYSNHVLTWIFNTWKLMCSSAWRALVSVTGERQDLCSLHYRVPYLFTCIICLHRTFWGHVFLTKPCQLVATCCDGTLESHSRRDVSVSCVCVCVETLQMTVCLSVCLSLLQKSVKAQTFRSYSF